MKDPIERQAAIDAVDFGITFVKVIDKSTGDVKELFQEGNLLLTEAIERIKNLPTAEPEQRWIPCSERLPGKDGWCLVTTYSSRGELMVSIASYYSIPKIFEDFGDSTLDVIAWMPYPEPYNPNQSVNQIDAAQPDEEKISDALYNIYRNKGTSTSAEGVAAIKYYIAEIWREIYGEEGPKWLKK